MLRDKTLIGLNLAVFLLMLGVGMIVAILPQKVIHLTGSGDLVGYLASAFALSYIILQIPIGNLSDKYGFKLFLIIGYLLSALTGLLFYFSNSANLIFFGRLLQGVAEAPIWALAPALLSIKYTLSKGKVMGIYNASIHFGLTIGPVLGVLLTKLWNGNEVFLFYSFVSFSGALVIYFLIDHVSNGETTKLETMNFKGILQLTSNRNTLIALLGITLYGAGYGIFLTLIPAFLIDIKNFNTTSVGLFFSLFYIAISLSQIITGPLSDRMGRKMFMIIGLTIAAIGIAIFPMLSQPWISIILTIASLGLGIFYLSSMAYLNEIVPNSLKGTISGAYYLFWGVGMFFGPILISKLSSMYNSSIGFYSFTSALLLEIAAMIISFNWAIKD